MPGVVLYYPGPGEDGWKIAHQILETGESLSFRSSNHSA